MDRNRIIETTLIATLALTVPAVTSGRTTERAALAVRVFNMAGVPGSDLETALEAAGAALGGAGIAVSWNLCSDAQRRPAVCDRSLEDGEVILRLMTSRTTAASSVTMGYAQIDPARPCSLLASVYWDQVLLVARNAAVDPRPLLGRAIAHEIGHLLINTSGHSGAGLMRAEWSQSELRLNAPRDWRFGDGEAQVMRAALTAAR